MDTPHINKLRDATTSMKEFAEAYAQTKEIYERARAKQPADKLTAFDAKKSINKGGLIDPSHPAGLNLRREMDAFRETFKTSYSAETGALHVMLEKYREQYQKAELAHIDYKTVAMDKGGRCLRVMTDEAKEQFNRVLNAPDIRADFTTLILPSIYFVAAKIFNARHHYNSGLREAEEYLVSASVVENGTSYEQAIALVETLHKLVDAEIEKLPAIVLRKPKEGPHAYGIEGQKTVRGRRGGLQ